MKRWLLAVAALLGPLVGLASADYVIIKIDLNKLFASQTENQQKFPGVPGGGMMGMPGGGMGMMGGGMMGRPGGGMGMMGGGMMGRPGMPGGGMMGMPGGGRGMMGGGMMGMPGGGRGMMGGGMMGMPSGPPAGYPSGGTPAGPPAGYPGLGRPGGSGSFPGAPGATGGQGSFPGGPGGPSGSGTVPGMPGMPGMPGAPSSPSGDAEPTEYHPLWAYAYLELRMRPKMSKASDGTSFALIENKWGKPVYVPVSAISAYIQHLSLRKRWENKVKADLKDGKTVDALLGLAEWALERGLLAEFEKTMDELKEVEPKNATLKTFEQTRAALKVAPSQDDPTATTLLKELTGEGYRPLRSELGHYTLLTNAKNAQNDASIKRRLARMEDTYQSFFYWFAFKGKPRTVPPYRLVAVMVKDPDPESSKEFETKHALFDLVPMLQDGFTARRDNVVLLSARRMDEAFNTLTRNNKQLFQNRFKVTAHDLLNNANLMKKRPDIAGHVPELQTLALVERAMEEESEWATVTHECVRQLEAATGLIPRNVNSAEWAQFGLASFFETPVRSFYATHGAPNWNQLINFKFLRKTNKLDAKQARAILESVVTDSYFRKGYQSLRQLGDISEDKDKDKLADKTADQLETARATGWALTYYLAHYHLDQLLAYYDELAKLPRDVEYDADVLKAAFGRAFNLMAADPNNPGKQILDRSRVERLANDWFNKMELTLLDMVEVEQEGLRSRARAVMEAKGSKANSGQQPSGANPTYPNPGGRPPYGPGTGGRPPYGPGMGNRPPYGSGGFRPGGRSQ